VAAKGRLQQALERARQRREGDAAVPPAQPATAPTAAERQSEIHAMRNFSEVEYDRVECAKNRVLVPDADGFMHATGAAAYRVLRTRILQRTRSNEWTTIGVTSPGQGDGKSVTALNLAISIAREGNNNVFLIDLDMRNPKMCQYLGAAPPVEINHYLTGDSRAEDVLFSIGVDNLTLAGTLTKTDQASELLASGRVEELFAYVRSIAKRPLIVVDLPPLLSTDDAIVMAPKVDACLLVLAEGKSRRDSAAEALELLAEFKLAGIVLNRSHDVVADYYST
jgi:capsular exopolysaccharide synthesis family protein